MGLKRCRLDGKVTFTGYRDAAAAAARLAEPGRAYWCPHAGGYHITRLEPGEYDQRRAASLAVSTQDEQENT